MRPFAHVVMNTWRRRRNETLPISRNVRHDIWSRGINNPNFSNNSSTIRAFKQHHKEHEMKYTALMYEHYHDNGDDAEPTIEPAVLTPTGTYVTGFDTIEDAKEYADILTRYGKGED